MRHLPTKSEEKSKSEKLHNSTALDSEARKHR